MAAMKAKDNVPVHHEVYDKVERRHVFAQMMTAVLWSKN